MPTCSWPCTSRGWVITSTGCASSGREGDFTTAPERSPLFARALARQVAQVLTAVPDGEVLEFGPGSGALAAELLAELDTLGCLPRRYLMLELSAELQQRQRAAIARRVPHLAGRVAWLAQLPERFTRRGDRQRGAGCHAGTAVSRGWMAALPSFT